MANLLFSVMRTIGSGLSAQRKRMESVASNIANAETTRSEDGLPYRRKTVVMREVKAAKRSQLTRPGHSLKLTRTSPLHMAGGIALPEKPLLGEEPAVEAQVVQSTSGPIKYVYDPHHPDANSEGYVAYPDINPVEEMVDMLTATRAYEANIGAMDAFRSMVEKALEI